MMDRSTCFVAVIPYRPEGPDYCSPYMVFEYGLALQAQKARLIFVEDRVSGNLFKNYDELCVFSREDLEIAEIDIAERGLITSLAKKVRGLPRLDKFLLRKVGLLIDSERGADKIYTAAVIERLREALVGFELEVIDTKKLIGRRSMEFAIEFDQYDFLIGDVSELLLAPWITGYIMGRFIPSIKLFYLDEGEDPRSTLLLPIVQKHRVQTQEKQRGFGKNSRILRSSNYVMSISRSCFHKPQGSRLRVKHVN